MKILIKIMTFLLVPFTMIGFCNCASAKMFQNKLPVEIGEAYFQESNADINVYIPIKSNPNEIILDSIYFQGTKVKLELDNESLAVGHFKRDGHQKQDMIMSHEPYGEYGNNIPRLTQKSPFKLKGNTCVVSYKHENKIKYFKIKNLAQKKTQAHP